MKETFAETRDRLPKSNVVPAMNVVWWNQKEGQRSSKVWEARQ